MESGGIEMGKSYLGDFEASISVERFNNNSTGCNDKTIVGQELWFKIHSMNFLFEV